MATFDLTPDEASSILDRLDRWYDGGTSAPATDAPIVHVEPVAPLVPVAPVVPAPTPQRVGARTQVRRLVASLRGRERRWQA